MLFGTSGDVMSKWIFENRPAPVCGGRGERRPPGDRSLPPREGGGSARTEGFTTSSEAFPTRARPYTNFKTTFHTKVNIQISTLITRPYFPHKKKNQEVEKTSEMISQNLQSESNKSRTRARSLLLH